MADSEERTPLLSPQAAPTIVPVENPPPSYDETVTSPQLASGSSAVVSCRVCQSSINVEGKIHQHVVKCLQCNEAT